jgi:hypothetical protein
MMACLDAGLFFIDRQDFRFFSAILIQAVHPQSGEIAAARR